MHQHGLQLFVDLPVALKLRLAGLDLVIEADRTHHCLLEVRTVDRDRQVGIFGLIAFDVG